MEPSILLIALGGTALLIAGIAYKAVWFVRKINSEEEEPPPLTKPEQSDV